MVFYLKVNRVESYTYKNLQHWINAITLFPDSCIYIMCDNSFLKENIIGKVVLPDTCYFLESSYNSQDLIEIVSNVTDEKWNKAGYAHLTTFLHARENNYNEFWNIDADDTFLCLKSERIVEMLQDIRLHAKKKKINIFSLDMWRTREPEHWTFGITYVSNTIDWISTMKEHSMKSNILEKIHHREKNVDSFFTYLKENTNLKIETFYYENLKFIHYSNDFFRRTIVSGFFHWKNNKLCFPILLYCFGLEEIGLIDIPKDIIKLDISITDEENREFLKNYSLDKHLIKEYESLISEVFEK